MKKVFKKLLLPISLSATIAASAVIGSISNVNDITYRSIKNSGSTLRSIPDINLSGSLNDNFSVQYDNGTNLQNDFSVGLNNSYWNLSFYNNTPVFNNYANKYVSTLSSFKNNIDTPSDNVTSNGISLKLYNSDGSYVPVASKTTNYTLGPSGNYGFKTNDSAVDPYTLNEYQLNVNNPLLKINYEYGWTNDTPASNRTPVKQGPFIATNVSNGWHFNGYVGLDSNLILSHYQPEVSTWISSNPTNHCFPRLTVSSNTYDREMTAIDFANSFASSYKRRLKLALSNNLPIEQVFNLRLRPVPAEGKVLLVYDLKNSVTKNDNWYGDVDAATIVKDQTVELASGFWINTEEISNTIDGQILTQGYIPSEVTENIFQQWVFNNKEKLWRRLPSGLALSDITVKHGSRVISPDDRQISYQVCLKKKYVNGEIKIITDVTDSDYKTITIQNFNRPEPTRVVPTTDLTSINITYQGKTLNWSKITPSKLQEIITARAKDPTPANSDTTYNQLIEKLAKIDGGIPIVSGQLAKITSISTSGITVNDLEGTITIPFVVNYAYEEQSGRMVKVNDKSFAISFNQLQKIVPTSNVQPTSVEGFDAYLINTVPLNTEAPTELKNAIIDSIWKIYQDDTRTPSLDNGGMLPPTATQANITSVKVTSVNKEASTATVSYTLTSYYDDTGKEQTTARDFSTTILGFYSPVATVDPTRTINITVPGIDKIVAKPDNLTIDLLKEKGVKPQDIFNFTSTTTTSKIEVKTFNGASYDWNMDGITLENIASDPSTGTMTAIAVTNHGFDAELNYQASGDFRQNIRISGFKETHASTLTDTNEFAIPDDSIYNQTIPQLILLNKRTEFQAYVKEQIANNIGNFVNYMPTSTDLTTPVANAIDLQLKDDYSNINGTMTATLSINKIYNQYGEVIDVPTSDKAAWTKDITIRLIPKNIHPTTFTNAISITINDIFANQLDQTKIESYYPGIKTSNDTIPNINITADASLSTPANITFKSKNPPEIVDGTKTVRTKATLTGLYINNTAGTDVIYDKDATLDFDVNFNGFKDVIQPSLKPSVDTLLIQGVPLINGALGQYFFMNDPLNGLTGSTASNVTPCTIEALENAINSQNLEKLFGDNYETLLPTDAKFKIKQIKSFNNNKGTIVIDGYFSKVFNQFHDEVTLSPSSPEATIYQNIKITGFLKVANPTFANTTKETVLTNNPIFGPEIVYSDLVTDKLILDYLKLSNMASMFNNDTSGNPVELDKDKMQLTSGSKVIGTVEIDRSQKDKILVKFNVTNGFKQEGENLVEVNPDFTAPYNKPLEGLWTIYTKSNGTTQMRSDVSTDDSLKIDGFVDDFLNPTTNEFDDAKLFTAIKTKITDPQVLFENSGRATKTTWNDFSFKVLTPTTLTATNVPNAAQGTIPVQFTMTSGKYYENDVEKTATTDSPKVFNTIIGTTKKRAVAGTVAENSPNAFKLNSSEIDLFNDIDVTGKFAYQVLELVNKDKLVDYVLQQIKLKPQSFIANTNPDATGYVDAVGKPQIPADNLAYKPNVFDTIKKSSIDIVADNKQGKLWVELKGFSAPGNLVRDKLGFFNTDPSKGILNIGKSRIEIVIDPAAGTMKKAEPLKIKDSYAVQGLSNISAKEYIEKFEDGDLENYIYKEILFKEYNRYYDDYTFANDTIFEGLNPNIGDKRIKSIADFKSWIKVDISRAQYDAQGVSGINLIVKYDYFRNDENYTWEQFSPTSTIESAPIPSVPFKFSIVGFGSSLAPVNWPIYVGIGVGVLAFLSICLLAFTWIRHKNKKLRYN